MKKVFTFLFTLLFSLGINAQSNNSIAYNAVNDTFRTRYNQQNFKDIYPLFSPDFQKKMSENQLVDFLKNKVYAGFGAASKSTLLKQDAKRAQYVWSSKNGEALFVFALDSLNHIMAFQFKPYEKPTHVSKSDNPMKTDFDKSVDNIARQYIDAGNNVGLSIGIVKDGQMTTYHYGTMDKKTMQLPNNQTIYEIGSITKTFTGTLLAQAILDKKINLDDDIRKYLPEKYPNLEYNGQPILVRHLANHTARLAGLPKDFELKKDYDPKNPYKYYTTDMVLNYLHTIKLDTTPGVKAEYSNYAAGLMGIILEKIYKLSYADLVKKYISDPLSMNDTKIDILPKDSVLFAKPYLKDGQLTNYWDITGLGAAGAIRSNIVDMLKYTQANMLQNNEALKLAQQPTFTEDDNQSTALYWQLLKSQRGQQITWHNGGTGGFSTFCGFSKALNVGVVLLANNAGADMRGSGIKLLNMMGS